MGDTSMSRERTSSGLQSTSPNRPPTSSSFGCLNANTFFSKLMSSKCSTQVVLANSNPRFLNRVFFSTAAVCRLFKTACVVWV